MSGPISRELAGTLLRICVDIATGWTEQRAIWGKNYQDVQKNWTHVRQWLGYDRLDNPKAVPLMNQLYTTEWRLFQNFFCPSVKLISKERIASKTVKRYDRLRTPYQRILASSEIDVNAKENLKAIYRTLNPFTLRKSMEAKLKAIMNTP